MIVLGHGLAFIERSFTAFFGKKAMHEEGRKSVPPRSSEAPEAKENDPPSPSG